MPNINIIKTFNTDHSSLTNFREIIVGCKNNDCLTKFRQIHPIARENTANNSRLAFIIYKKINCSKQKIMKHRA